MNNFVEMNSAEYDAVNGGGIILAGCAIVGGCIAVFGVSFAVGYGLAKWLG